MGTGQAGGGRPVLPREQGGASKGSEEVTGACEMVCLSWGMEEIPV